MDKVENMAMQSFQMPKDDHTIFEAIMEDEPQKIYEVLDEIQAPFRAYLISLLEEIDDKCKEHISDEEIETIDNLLFDEQGQEKFLNAKAFKTLGSFLKDEKNHVPFDDVQKFDNLDREHRSKIAHFLGSVRSINGETPIIHACIWGKLYSATIIKDEGAEMPANLLRKVIQWAIYLQASVNWVLDNGSQVTLDDIDQAKAYRKEDIASQLEAVYKKQHPDYVPMTEGAFAMDVKASRQGATSRIGRKARGGCLPPTREGRS